MAEAHQAVAFNLSITHDGLRINYDREVLGLVFNSGVRSWKRRFTRFTGNFKAGIYPSSVEFLLSILAVVMSARFVLGVDTSFGFIDFLNSSIISRLIGPLLGLPSLGCTIVSCTIFGILVWWAKALSMRYLLKFLLMYKGWMVAARATDGGASKHIMKLWILLVKGLTLKTPLLNSYQTALPRLPLPSVNDTIERYLRSVQPLVSDEDYKRLAAEAEDFRLNLAPRLQWYLVLKSWWSSNYVSDWWEEYVYLRGRSAIMVNSNYYGIDALLLKPTERQTSRAATLVYAALLFRRQIDRLELKPLLLNNLVPLCSWQYERIFNTTRIPGKETDKIVHLDDSQHIVVMHKGRFFRVDLYHKSRLMLPKDFEAMFDKILADPTPATEDELHLAALTATDRVTWHEAREEYFKKGINRISLRVVEKAAFIVCLEEESHSFEPLTEEVLSQFGRSLLHGKGHDRWYDKSFNLVVNKNGKIGFNAEHSWADAPVMGHFWEFVLSYEMNNTCYDSEGKSILGSGVSTPNPVKLKWDIPTTLSKTITEAKSDAETILNDIDLQIVIFQDYGKGFMKKCRVSPDAFIQLAFQLAYYRDNGKFCLTYEASMTRLFREGRTETVRPVTIESSTFARAFDDTNKSREDKIALMKVASQVHTTGYQNAMCGKGIDRHLFCLYVISKYLEVDSPFLKEVLSEPWKLSTSQTPHGQTQMDLKKNPKLISCGGGFGPVADDGYGISYIIAGEDTVFFHISSKKSSPQTDTTRFANQIRKALLDMRSLLK